MYNGVFTTHGDPDETYSLTGVDAAKSLSEYGVRTVMPNGVQAVAVLITVETQNARIQWGSRTGAGHVVASGNSYMGYGSEVVRKLKVGNATASSNATLKITCFF